MKRISVEELSKLLLVKGGDDQDRAAAVAALSSVLADLEPHRQLPVESQWEGAAGKRQGLHGAWKSQLQRTLASN
jgi:hypothetical protein